MGFKENFNELHAMNRTFPKNVCLLVIIGLLSIFSTPVNGFQSKKDSVKHTAKVYQTLDLISEIATAHLEGSPNDLTPPVPVPLTVEGRLQALDSQIPFTHNPRVQSYIDIYSSDRYNSYLSRMMGLGQFYFQIYDRIFEEIGVPREIKYLSIVESALNPHAVSRMGATGPWQFMFATAKMYGLTMDQYMDERKDPIASSYAAATYLQAAYEQFGDWFLAIAAYNCGPGNVTKAIQRSGLENPDYWDIIEYLPKETRNYVPAFIAMTYMLEYHEEHGVHPTDSDLPQHIEIVKVQHHIPFSLLAEVLQIDESLVSKLNPAYKRNLVNGTAESPRRLVLPPVAPSFYQNLYVVLTEPANSTMDVFFASDNTVGKDVVRDESQTFFHQVEKGESLGRIATRFGVTVQDLKSWNNLKSNTIVPGQRLTIEGKGSSAAKVYTVKRGDTLSGIAKQFKGATVTQIKTANGLKSNNIKPGMKLRVL